MTKHEQNLAFSRRSVLLGGGALVVSVGAAGALDTVLSMQSAYAQGAKPPLTPDQLSSYIAVNADGTVAAYFGKMDMGHGLYVAIGQIVAEELDVPFKAVKVYMGDTGTIGEPGRRVGLDRHPARRQADAHGGGGSAPRAGRDGGEELWRCRPSKLVVNDGVVSCRRQRRQGQARLLRRDDRRQVSSTSSSTGTSNTATRSTRPARRSRRSRASTRSSASRSSARTSRPRCSRRKTSAPTSKCRAWCMAA